MHLNGEIRAGSVADVVIKPLSGKLSATYIDTMIFHVNEDSTPVCLHQSNANIKSIPNSRGLSVNEAQHTDSKQKNNAPRHRAPQSTKPFGYK